MTEPDGPPHDLSHLIEVLDRHGVEYLIVGGAAAFAYGARRPTEDADCVVGRERVNLDRLAAALRELNARLRVAGMTDAEARELPVQVDATTLDMAGMTTWMTAPAHSTSWRDWRLRMAGSCSMRNLLNGRPCSMAQAS